MRIFRSKGLRFANLLLSSDFSNLLFQITPLFDTKLAIKIGNTSKHPMIFYHRTFLSSLNISGLIVTSIFSELRAMIAQIYTSIHILPVYYRVLYALFRAIRRRPCGSRSPASRLAESFPFLPYRYVKFQMLFRYDTYLRLQYRTHYFLPKFTHIARPRVSKQGITGFPVKSCNIAFQFFICYFMENDRSKRLSCLLFSSSITVSAVFMGISTVKRLPLPFSLSSRKKLNRELSMEIIRLEACRKVYFGRHSSLISEVQ